MDRMFSSWICLMALSIIFLNVRLMNKYLQIWNLTSVQVLLPVVQTGIGLARVWNEKMINGSDHWLPHTLSVLLQ